MDVKEDSHLRGSPHRLARRMQRVYEIGPLIGPPCGEDRLGSE